MAALQASVDRNPASMNESLTLTLQSSDNLNGTPDLSVLQRDFDVINQGKSSSFQFINGTTSRSTQWSITLMPKHSGQIEIPPIRIGNGQSTPITLTVNDDTAPTQGSTPQGDIFLEVSAAPHQVYVQQQVIYTVRLFHAINLGNNATLSEPKLAGDDAIVEKLGDDKNYQTSRNGVRYAVVERRYAIYPQHSGSIRVQPLMFNGDVIQASANSFFNFDPFATHTRHQRVVSTPITITALAIPTSFHDAQWLPAHNLQLVEQWSPDPPHFTVGQPITRTIAVMADGLTSAQLPPISSNSTDGMKLYPDQPSLKDTKASDGITGIRSEKIAMIPMHPGTITLPAIAIPWWNTASNKAEVAQLPARTVNVAPASGNNALTKPAPPTITAPSAAHKADVSPPPITSGVTSTVTTAGFWPWLALLLGLGWFSTAVTWWWRTRRPVSITPPTHEKRESLLQLETNIKSSCLANDAHSCNRAILSWAQQRWPDQPPVSLTTLALRYQQPLAEQLQALDRALYASVSTPWQGMPLWQAFSHARKKEKSSPHKREEALQPLYSE